MPGFKKLPVQSQGRQSKHRQVLCEMSLLHHDLYAHCTAIEIFEADGEFSRIWPLSKKGGGKANDIGGGSKQQLLGALEF